MPDPDAASPVDDPWCLDEAERVALAYLRDARGDRWTALVRLAEDALGDLASADAAIRARERQISRGYVRGAIDA